ncbi:MAG: hypothetical protein J6Z14_04665 [Prevotella sp.]|nr:hypothetical protein [Prevotella sp.]
MKNQYLLLWLALALLSFACCSKDEDVNNVPDSVTQEGLLLVEGRQWCVGSCVTWPVYGDIIGHIFFSIDGNYECNGKTYKRIRETIPAQPELGLEKDNVRYLKPMREENGRIYVLDTLSKKETLDFDCNVKVGDKDPQGYAVTDIISRSVSAEDETLRKCFIMEVKDPYTPEPAYIREYIEGIGYVDGAFLHDPLTTGGFFVLVCCHEADGKCIYGESGHDCKSRSAGFGIQQK